MEDSFFKHILRMKICFQIFQKFSALLQGSRFWLDCFCLDLCTIRAAVPVNALGLWTAHEDLLIIIQHDFVKAN